MKKSTRRARALAKNPRVRPYQSYQLEHLHGVHAEARRDLTRAQIKEKYDRTGRQIEKRSRQGDTSRGAQEARQTLRAKREGLRRAMKANMTKREWDKKTKFDYAGKLSPHNRVHYKVTVRKTKFGRDTLRDREVAKAYGHDPRKVKMRLNGSAAARVDALAQSYKKASPGRKKAIYKQWRAAVAKRDGLQSNPRVRPWTASERKIAASSYYGAKSIGPSHSHGQLKHLAGRIKASKGRGKSAVEYRQSLRAARLGHANYLSDYTPNMKKSTKRKKARKVDKGRRDMARVEQIRARYGVYGR